MAERTYFRELQESHIFGWENNNPLASEFMELIEEVMNRRDIDQLLSQLFSSAEVINTKEGCKYPASIKFRINRNNNNIWVNNARKPYVEAYLNPFTGLMVCEDEVRHNPEFNGKRDKIVYTPHHQFQILTQLFCAVVAARYMERLEGYGSGELGAIYSKPVSRIREELNAFLANEHEIYTQLAKDLSFMQTPDVPPTNQFMAFADDHAPEYYVSGRVKYPNPQQHLDMDTRLVDRFLDVFFEETDKARFSWYMGAALRNKKVSDASVSKMLMVSSARAGSGKSTLATSLVKALFGKEFGNISGDFDSHFRRDNRFVSSQMINARMNVYLEAEFGVATKDGNNHDFTGLDVSAIKTMITDGLLSTEEKYQSRKSQRAFGLHMVLTNHPARINEDSDALRRRILPCLIKSSSMEDKAKQLGLFGQENLENWVMNHALEFAVYFVRYHMQHEYDYMNYLYNDKAFIREVNHYKNKTLAERDPIALMVRNRDNVFSVLDTLRQNISFDLDKFIQTIENTPRGIHYGDVRITNGVAYINASVKFWSQFSDQADTVRDALIEVYGAPEKKYQQNRFVIPCLHTDLSDFYETQDAIERHVQKDDVEPQQRETQVVVDGDDIELPELSEQIKTTLKSMADELVEQTEKRSNDRKIARKKDPKWMQFVDKSTLVGYKDQENADEVTPKDEEYADSLEELIDVKLDKERTCFSVHRRKLRQTNLIGEQRKKERLKQQMDEQTAMTMRALTEKLNQMNADIIAGKSIKEMFEDQNFVFAPVIEQINKENEEKRAREYDEAVMFNAEAFNNSTNNTTNERN